jgi:hypothetical protein
VVALDDVLRAMVVELGNLVSVTAQEQTAERIARR